MKLHGRITIYGEYLMRASTCGLVIPSQLHLATSEHINNLVHEKYDHSNDEVARYLERRCFATKSKLYGNLPFGFGLASSTVLAFLHLHPTKSISESIPIVNECDHNIHGFKPSGVDTASISRQAPGLFSIRGWEDIHVTSFPYTLVFLPAERERTLAEIKRRMNEGAASLTRIADDLTNQTISTGRLDYTLFLKYTRTLFIHSVYSKVATSFIATFLNSGIAAKAIGGLYDKAILIVWPNSKTAKRYMCNLTDYHHVSALDHKQ
jgi:hypothetical protein